MSSGRDNPFDLQCKLLMIGDSGKLRFYFSVVSSYYYETVFLLSILSILCSSLGVGKTCLLLRYASDSFSPTFITTIGIDFKIKNILLDGKRIKLQVSIVTSIHSPNHF